MDIIEGKTNKWFYLCKMDRVDLNTYNIDLGTLEDNTVGPDVFYLYEKKNEEGQSLRDQVTGSIMNIVVDSLNPNDVNEIFGFIMRNGDAGLKFFNYPFVYSGNLYVLLIPTEKLADYFSLVRAEDIKDLYDNINDYMKDVEFIKTLLMIALVDTGVIDNSCNRSLIGCFQCKSYKELDLLLRDLIDVDIVLSVYKVANVYDVFFYGGATESNLITEITDGCDNWTDYPEIDLAYAEEHGKDVTDNMYHYYNEILKREENRLDVNTRRHLNSIVKRSLMEDEGND